MLTLPNPGWFYEEYGLNAYSHVDGRLKIEIPGIYELGITLNFILFDITPFSGQLSGSRPENGGGFHVYWDSFYRIYALWLRTVVSQ